MHVRKLVRSGNSSLVAAIPQDWIKRNKLKAGDVLYLDERNNILHVTSDYKEDEPEKSEIVINVDGKTPRLVSRAINAAYLNNYHYMIIKGKELKHKLNEIKSHISSLIALEVIDERADKIVAENFVNLREADVKVLIRRMDNIIRSMITDAIEADNDPETIENIAGRDKGVNRLNLLISKILKVAHNEKSLLGALNLKEIDILRYWDLNGHLEKIGDRVKNMSRQLPALKGTHKKDAIELTRQIEELYKTVMKAYYDWSLDLSNKASTKRLQLYEDIKKFIEKTKCPECSQVAINAFNMVSHINDIARIVRYIE